MNALKTYLGDGVYAEPDRFGGITLTTSNGVSVSNEIYLEDFVIEALERLIKQMNDSSNH